MDQNTGVETLLLAYMVNHPGLYSKLAHYPAEIFYDEHHRKWFDAIRDCYSETGECDTLAIRTRLINEGHETSFTEKFDAIATAPVVATSLDTHIEALLDSYHLRKLKGFAYDVMQSRTFAEGHEVMTRAVNETMAGCGDVSAGIDEIADESTLVTVGQVTPTGFIGLDKVIRGFGETDLIVVGGHAKDGKTTLSLQLAFDMSRTDVTNYYTLEMPRGEMLAKIAARKAGIKYGVLTSGQMSEAERIRLKTTLDVFRSKAYKFEIIDGIEHIDAILAHAKVAKMTKGVKRIVIDYLQLCEAKRERNMSRYEVIGSITRRLKQFANKEHVNVIALSQMNGDKNERPTLQSFRESGNIGQDCNIGMAVWYDPKEQQRKIILMPGRRCAETDINVEFRGEYSEFVDMSIERCKPWNECERP